MPVRHLEELLDTEIHRFELPDELDADRARRKQRSPRRILRAASDIVIPEHLQLLISFLSVNSHPLHLRALASATTANENVRMMATTAASNTLELIRHTYGIPDDLVATNANNLQCVPSFYDEGWSPSDLELFHTHSLPEDEQPKVIAKGDRQNQEGRPTTEASLDIQYITGVGRNATTYMWTMNGSNPFSSEDEPFVEFLEAILAMDAPPLVVSISYSDDEEHIFNVAASYAHSMDTLLIKMGLRGITVLMASGDDGVTGLRPEFERIPRTEMCNQSGPQWPSGNPYITTVGATIILNAEDFAKPFFKTSEEVVCSSEVGGIITTGGGFSNVYAMPDYQREAVSAYLKTSRVPTTPGFFNASGRAYPDISALGASFMVYINGRMTAVSGTSASTPVIGGMVTLWNDIRLNAGKSSLGFINPLLYYMQKNTPGAFHDIVTGNNGAPRGGDVCSDSFGATAGWDAVSGVGTPNFQVIADFVLSLEDHFDVSALDATPSCTNSTASVDNTTYNAATGDGSDSDSDGAVTWTLLIIGLAGNAVTVGFLLFSVYKRLRNQYMPLSSGGSGAGSEKDTRRSPHESVSPTSPLRRNQPASDADGDAPVGEEIELSEISLHD
jgi:tripeptidyl-peptidase-1